MKSITAAGSVLFLFAALTGACFEDVTVGADDAGVTADGGGKACSTSADCAANEACGFASADACNAKGACFAVPGVECAAYSAGCACDGTEINVACTGLPTGYDTKPLAHAGACIDGGGAADAGASCTTSADCAANELCGFARADACTAKGTCFAQSGVQCNSFEPGCACDGTPINLACNDLPAGYETKPYLHAGACEGGGGTAIDGGAPCTSTADCGASEICGFPAADACSAKGTCFASPGVTCGAFSAGCACDGTEINVACNGLPTGYETSPLAHTGACTPPGSSSDAATGG